MEITIDGAQFDISSILNGNFEADNHSPFEKKTLVFIHEYLSGQSAFTLQTSGSTGTPKAITFNRTQLQNSAIRTNEFFGLVPGKSLLCCLNPDFVAGKMMIVRALEGKLNLIIKTPASNPLSDLDSKQFIDFIALTPLQISHILQQNPKKLKQIGTVLIGGAALNPTVEAQLQKQKSMIFHSYAMTETLTHVALKEVNGTKKSLNYHALPGISFGIDKRNCLIIRDNILKIDHLVTNDIVELIDEKTFRWIGRFDNIVNSGGIKIQIEETEVNIAEILREMDIEIPLCLLSLPDTQLGEKLILLIEKKIDHLDTHKISEVLKDRLTKYHSPKEILLVPEIIMTGTGKPDRIKNRELYLS